ncbi:hypothetical protein CHU98_g7123 [Xylaria longipes]|nr:hypothetical protein CHU98_g7123 [Xylaria longipes]
MTTSRRDDRVVAYRGAVIENTHRVHAAVTDAAGNLLFAIRRLGAQGAVGTAVKIEDGDVEILYAVVMEILQQLDISTQEQRQSLYAFHYPARTNTAGETTGRVTFDQKVRPERIVVTSVPMYNGKLGYTLEPTTFMHRSVTKWQQTIDRSTGSHHKVPVISGSEPIMSMVFAESWDDLCDP